MAFLALASKKGLQRVISIMTRLEEIATLLSLEVYEVYDLTASLLHTKDNRLITVTFLKESSSLFYVV